MRSRRHYPAVQHQAPFYDRAQWGGQDSKLLMAIRHVPSGFTCLNISVQPTFPDCLVFRVNRPTHHWRYNAVLWALRVPRAVRDLQTNSESGAKTNGENDQWDRKENRYSWTRVRVQKNALIGGSSSKCFQDAPPHKHRYDSRDSSAIRRLFSSSYFPSQQPCMTASPTKLAVLGNLLSKKNLSTRSWYWYFSSADLNRPVDWCGQWPVASHNRVGNGTQIEDVCCWRSHSRLSWVEEPRIRKVSAVNFPTNRATKIREIEV